MVALISSLKHLVAVIIPDDHQILYWIWAQIVIILTYFSSSFSILFCTVCLSLTCNNNFVLSHIMYRHFIIVFFLTELIFANQGYEVHSECSRIKYPWLMAIHNSNFSRYHFMGCKQLPMHPIKLSVAKHILYNRCPCQQKNIVFTMNKHQKKVDACQYIITPSVILNNYAKLWDSCILQWIFDW